MATTRSLACGRRLSRRPVRATTSQHRRPTARADLADGEDGNDTLITGNGYYNEVYGGNDADTIVGGTGSDYLDGQSGNDSISGGGSGTYTTHDPQRRRRVHDTLIAGDGGNQQQNLYGGNGNDSIDGSAVTTDNEYFNGQGGNDTMLGGSGNETFYDDGSSSDSMSGGAGNDSFQYVDYFGGQDTLSGGPGQDTYQLLWQEGTGGRPAEITDFTPGSGGDIVDISWTLANAGLQGYHSGDNPFTTGYMRLAPSSENTLVLHLAVTSIRAIRWCRPPSTAIRN